MDLFFPVTALFLWKICFSFRTSRVILMLKELIWCTSDPNVDIRIFRKRWRLILEWFFLVSILNGKLHFCAVWEALLAPYVRSIMCSLFRGLAQIVYTVIRALKLNYWDTIPEPKLFRHMGNADWSLFLYFSSSRYYYT